MEILFPALLSAIIAYLLGSLNFAIIVSKLLFKTDIRTVGSKNAGMTNVLRNFGKGPAIIVLIGDLAKGILAVYLGNVLFSAFIGDKSNIICGYIAGFFALLGHILPLFNGFKGGKGILVSGGVVLALDYRIFLCVVGVFLICVVISKIVSISSIITSISYPIATFIFKYIEGSKYIVSDTIMSIVIALIVLYMHKDNIKRLIDGTEYKFKKSEQ